MWVLLVMLLTSNDEVVAYDQGHFTSFDDCFETGEAMISDLDGAYTYTCVQWKK